MKFTQGDLAKAFEHRQYAVCENIIRSQPDLCNETLCIHNIYDDYSHINFTPLQAACALGASSLVNIIFSAANDEGVRWQLATTLTERYPTAPLHFAARSGDAETIGIFANYFTPDQLSPLINTFGEGYYGNVKKSAMQLSIEYNHAAVTQAIIDLQNPVVTKYAILSLHITQENSTHYSPLFAACKQYNEATLVLLLDQFSEVTKVNGQNCRILKDSTDLEVVKNILTRTDENGNTLMHIAVRHAAPEASCQLVYLARGCGIESDVLRIHNDKNELPLHIAIQYRSKGILSRLIPSALKFTNTNVSDAAKEQLRHDVYGQTPFLPGCDADPKCDDIQRGTIHRDLLRYCIQYDNPDAIKILSHQWVNYDITDEITRTLCTKHNNNLLSLATGKSPETLQAVINLLGTEQAKAEISARKYGEKANLNLIEYFHQHTLRRNSTQDHHRKSISILISIWLSAQYSKNTDYSYALNYAARYFDMATIQIILLKLGAEDLKETIKSVQKISVKLPSDIFFGMNLVGHLKHYDGHNELKGNARVTQFKKLVDNILFLQGCLEDLCSKTYNARLQDEIIKFAKILQTIIKAEVAPEKLDGELASMKGEEITRFGRPFMLDIVNIEPEILIETAKQLIVYIKEFDLSNAKDRTETVITGLRKYLEKYDAKKQEKAKQIQQALSDYIALKKQSENNSPPSDPDSTKTSVSAAKLGMQKENSKAEIVESVDTTQRSQLLSSSTQVQEMAEKVESDNLTMQAQLRRKHAELQELQNQYAREYGDSRDGYDALRANPQRIPITDPQRYAERMDRRCDRATLDKSIQQQDIQALEASLLINPNLLIGIRIGIRIYNKVSQQYTVENVDKHLLVIFRACKYSNPRAVMTIYETIEQLKIANHTLFEGTIHHMPPAFYAASWASIALLERLMPAHCRSNILSIERYKNKDTTFLHRLMLNTSDVVMHFSPHYSAELLLQKNSSGKVPLQLALSNETTFIYLFKLPILSYKDNSIQVMNNNILFTLLTTALEKGASQSAGLIIDYIEHYQVQNAMVQKAQSIYSLMNNAASCDITVNARLLTWYGIDENSERNDLYNEHSQSPMISLFLAKRHFATSPASSSADFLSSAKREEATLTPLHFCLANDNILLYCWYLQLCAKHMNPEEKHRLFSREFAAKDIKKSTLWTTFYSIPGCTTMNLLTAINVIPDSRLLRSTFKFLGYTLFIKLFLNSNARLSMHFALLNKANLDYIIEFFTLLGAGQAQAFYDKYSHGAMLAWEKDGATHYTTNIVESLARNLMTGKITLNVSSLCFQCCMHADVISIDEFKTGFTQLQSIYHLYKHLDPNNFLAFKQLYDNLYKAYRNCQTAKIEISHREEVITEALKQFVDKLEQDIDSELDANFINSIRQLQDVPKSLLYKSFTSFLRYLENCCERELVSDQEQQRALELLNRATTASEQGGVTMRAISTS